MGLFKLLGGKVGEELGRETGRERGEEEAGKIFLSSLRRRKREQIIREHEENGAQEGRQNGEKIGKGADIVGAIFGFLT